MREILSAIDQHKYISFDIFDTLITRTLLFPRDVFVEAEKKYAAISSNKINNFRKWRILAEERAVEIAIQDGREECTFDEIYEQIGELLSLSVEDISLLQQCELDVELEICLPRSIGEQLLLYAISKKKIVFFTSDMYLDKESIKQLLVKSGIPLVNDKYFFVSSEIGKKKKTGSLFEYISETLKISKSDIVHIGDNPIGDYKMPLAASCDAYLLSQAKDNIIKTPMGEAIYSYFKNNRHPLSDNYLFLITNKYFDEEKNNPSFFQGSPYRLGYMALSTLAISFCIWLHQQVKLQKVEHLFFLSRDMRFIYEAYKLLYPSEKVSYLLASRRSVRVPLLNNLSDLLSPVYQVIYSNRIGSWLNFNYGLEETEDILCVLEKYNIDSFDFMIGGKFNKKILENIVRDLEDKIYVVASKEKEYLIGYLQENGIDKNDVAIVDIGYAASMQASYCKLLNRDIKGFYFATFNTAINNLHNASLSAGYVTNLGSSKSTGHGISTHRFVYESLFCDASDSFKCFQENISGDIIASFDTPKFDDSVRREKISEIHEGVIEFIEDYIHYFGMLEGLNIPPLDYISASYPLSYYLNSPELQDLKILSGIRFYDGEAPNAEKYILAPDTKMARTHSLWAEGYAILSFKPVAKPMTKLVARQSVQNKTEVQRPVKNREVLLEMPQYNSMRKVEMYLVQKFTSEKKQNKYYRDRTSFFYDSDSKFMQWYFKHIGYKY